jgi:hypothetical protein
MEYEVNFNDYTFLSSSFSSLNILSKFFKNLEIFFIISSFKTLVIGRNSKNFLMQIRVIFVTFIGYYEAISHRK